MVSFFFFFFKYENRVLLYIFALCKNFFFIHMHMHGHIHFPLSDIHSIQHYIQYCVDWIQERGKLIQVAVHIHEKDTSVHLITV